MAKARSASTIPPTPMMGKPLPSSARNCSTTARERACSGAPLSPPRRSSGQPGPSADRSVVVLVAMTPSIPSERTVAASEEICPDSKSGAILTSTGTRLAWSLPSPSRVSRSAPRTRFQSGGVLQFPQARGVRGGDIDGDVIGLRIDLAHAENVILRRSIDGRVGVLADADPADSPIAGAFEASDEVVDPLVVEAHPVHERDALRGPKHARPRVAGLRPRRHRAELDVAESQGPEGVEIIAVLVEAGGQAQRMRKAQARAGDRERRRDFRRGPERPHPMQSGEAQIVRRFGRQMSQHGKRGAGDGARETSMPDTHDVATTWTVWAPGNNARA